MRFRRGSGARRMFQTKQFLVTLGVANDTNVAGFFASDGILLGADELFGISAPIQASMKKVTIVGVEWYFDGVMRGAADIAPDIVLFNYVGLYKDTLDPSSVLDSSGTFFLNADQVNGTVNQQLWPERVLDRRSFTVGWTSSAPMQPFFNLASFNPTLSLPRIVRRKVSITSREALAFRVEAFLPANGGAGQNALDMQVYGVVTYRVDL